MHINYSQSTYNKNRFSNRNAMISARNNNVSFQGKTEMILNKFSQFIPSEYEHLSSFEKMYLRFRFNLFSLFNKDALYKDAINIHEPIVTNLKNNLDNSFGENNYVVVLIGRSLSSIGKMLEYKIGKENVKQIPMSDARRFNVENPLENRSNSEINSFNSYLGTIGLSREEVSKSKKKFLIMDYCESGESLKGAVKLLKSDKILGNQDNIIECDFMKYITDKKVKEEADIYINRKEFKQFSFVDESLSLKNTASKSKRDSNTVPVKTKLAWFTLLDRHMRGKKSS